VEIPAGIYEEITGLTPLPPPVDEADYERRKYRRVPFGCRATVSPEARKGVDTTPVVVMVRDVSEAGFSFLHTEALKPGLVFLVEFKGHQDRPVKLKCTVARCEAGGSGGTQFVIGSMFDELLTKELPPKSAGIPSLVQIAAEIKPLETKRTDANVSDAKGTEPARATGLFAQPKPAPTPPADPKSSAPPGAPAPAAAQVRTTGKTTMATSDTEQAHASTAAPVPASTPESAPKPSGLFKAADPTAPAAPNDEAWLDELLGLKADAPKPAADPGAPVFRDVPLPPDPEVPAELEQLPERESYPEPEQQMERELQPEPEPTIETQPVAEAQPVAETQPVPQLTNETQPTAEVEQTAEEQPEQEAQPVAEATPAPQPEPIQLEPEQKEPAPPQPVQEQPAQPQAPEPQPQPEAHVQQQVPMQQQTEPEQQQQPQTQEASVQTPTQTQPTTQPQAQSQPESQPRIQHTPPQAAHPQLEATKAPAGAIPIDPRTEAQIRERRDSAEIRRKHHEVLSRVKELLVKQEQVIKKQQEDLKAVREQAKHQAETLVAELNATKKRLEDLRVKNDADDSDIADLANFLSQHAATIAPVLKNEAA